MQQSLFEKACAKRGQRALDYRFFQEVEFAENLISEFRIFAQSHSATRRPGYRVECGFYESSSFNAFASIVDCVDVVAISWGVVLKLRKVFEAFIDDQFFHDANEEQKARFLQWFCRVGTHYFFLHEFAHCWQGHLDYLKAASGVEFIEEINEISGDMIPELDYRTLEFDADAFAATNIFQFSIFYEKFPAFSSQI